MLLWLLNLGFAGGGAPAALPAPAQILVSFQPATAIAVAFQPVTAIDIAYQQATRIRMTMTTSPLYVGDTNDIDVEFRNSHTAELVDPSSVTVRVQLRATSTAPAGPLVTYTYGVDAVLTRLSLGKYRAAIPCTAAGWWDGAWVSVGPTAPGAKPFSYEVRATV